jgi:hypothetical protein
MLLNPLYAHSGAFSKGDVNFGEILMSFMKLAKSTSLKQTTFDSIGLLVNTADKAVYEC